MSLSSPVALARQVVVCFRGWLVMRSLPILVSACVAVTLAATPAMAADLGAEPQAPLQTADPQMEFGNSWYLRGDIGAVLETQPKISNDLNWISGSKRKAAAAGDVGFGYKFNNWFRTDVFAEYRAGQTRSGVGGLMTNCPTLVGGVVTPGSCNVNGYSQFTRWNLMANAYADLGNWGGVTPYIGAGVGLSNSIRVGSVKYTVVPTGAPYVSPVDPVTLLPISPVVDRVKASSGSNQFAWNVMAGVGYALNEHATIDLGYRYLNMGHFSGVADSTGKIIKQSLTSHEVRMGMRYMID
jgi:opacity protein-like surface antigen